MSEPRAELPGPGGRVQGKASPSSRGPARPGSPVDVWDQAGGALTLCPHACSLPRVCAQCGLSSSHGRPCSVWDPWPAHTPVGSRGGWALLLSGGGPHGPHCLSRHCLAAQVPPPHLPPGPSSGRCLPRHAGVCTHVYTGPGLCVCARQPTRTRLQGLSPGSKHSVSPGV